MKIWNVVNPRSDDELASLREICQKEVREGKRYWAWASICLDLLGRIEELKSAAPVVVSERSDGSIAFTGTIHLDR